MREQNVVSFPPILQACDFEFFQEFDSHKDSNSGDDLDESHIKNLRWILSSMFRCALAASPPHNTAEF